MTNLCHFNGVIKKCYLTRGKEKPAIKRALIECRNTLNVYSDSSTGDTTNNRSPAEIC